MCMQQTTNHPRKKKQTTNLQLEPKYLSLMFKEEESYLSACSLTSARKYWSGKVSLSIREDIDKVIR